MTNILILIPAAISLAFLLFFEKKENHTGMVVSKACLSSLFVFTAVIQTHPNPGYYHWILAGLILCLGGDISLALPQEKMFKVGLVLFLLGHVLYVTAFFQAAQAGAIAYIGSAAVLIVSLVIYFWLRPHLGAMNLPVVLYIAVITVMLAGALSVLADLRFSQHARLTIFGGALLFYISDVFVARHRFVQKTFINRLIGLPLYNAGQFLLAFSTGLLEAV
jgi:uncharacterized membrane protein YhhN